ncbi:MAG: GNAT family N-acetyltransferase, partial [Burkholderiales bacterium]
METSVKTTSGESKLRRLAQRDLDAVVGIDAALMERSRRDYFKRRLDAALREPSLHLQFALEQGPGLAGYVLARRLEGEFGRVEPAFRLEIIGVTPGAQRRGIGSKLLEALESEAKRQGIRELRTQAAWRNHGMLRFLDHAGFELGRNQVIDCVVHGGRIVEGEEERIPAPEHHRTTAELDYSAPAANDYETLARDRADVRSLASGDVGNIVRIDHRITGRDRTAYITRLVGEALNDSAIRVSLAAYRDGSVSGYIMAKVDFGDFGRTEPVAVIDTIGVDPGFAGTGIGTALLSQLFVNLEALHVERVET